MLDCWVEVLEVKHASYNVTLYKLDVFSASPDGLEYAGKFLNPKNFDVVNIDNYNCFIVLSLLDNLGSFDCQLYCSSPAVVPIKETLRRKPLM